MVRKHIYYSGMVQGVGFRYTAARLAGGFEVRGFVRNMRDGRVEIVIEGEPATVDCFLDELARDMEVYIRDVKVTDEPYSGEFDRFDIRY